MLRAISKREQRLKVTKNFPRTKEEKSASHYGGPPHFLSRESYALRPFVGYLLLVVVVSWLAYLSHIPEPYILGIVVILLGIGAVSGLEHDRQKNLRY